MQIELISKEDYDTLLSIQQNFPNLTFQKQGYAYIDKKKLSKEDFEAMKTVSDILLKSVKGFTLFNNFRLTHDNKIQIRLQHKYNYNYDECLSFIGVEYILLDELLNGFKSGFTYIQKT